MTQSGLRWLRSPAHRQPRESPFRVNVLGQRPQRELGGEEGKEILSTQGGTTLRLVSYLSMANMRRPHRGLVQLLYVALGKICTKKQTAYGKEGSTEIDTEG